MLRYTIGWSRAACGVLLALGLPLRGLACKYSVRDVGFVDLRASKYELYFFANETMPKKLVDTLPPIGSATFIESNLALKVVDLRAHPEDPALWLTKDAMVDRFPAAVLRSPEGRGIQVPLPHGAISRDALWDLVEGVVESPKRNQILKMALKSMAIVVLVEGRDEAENRRVHQAVEGAVADITKQMPRMAKPVDYPPEVIVIRQEELPTERILLWSLGLATEPRDEPQAAILVGRGRRLGPPLEGGMLTRTKLQAMLALVGQDCECDLDRSWMQGPMIPLRWDSEMQRSTFHALGFDPENPLIKGEISRILARGPNFRRSGGRPLQGARNAGFLGYTEELIGGDQEGAVRPSASPVAQTASNQRPVLPASPPGPGRGLRGSSDPDGSEPKASAAGEVAEITGPFLWSPWTAVGGVVLVALFGGGWVLLQTKGR